MGAQKSGNARPTKTMSESTLFMADIVGDEGLAGQRMQAGAILDLIDVLAGRIAVEHARSPVVTLAFDRVELTYPILHQDLVRLEGKMAAVGSSSMTVHVQGYRMDPLSRKFRPIQSCYVTMVAVDEHLRPNKNIPGLKVTRKDEQALHEDALAHKARSMEWERIQQQSAPDKILRVRDVEEPINREKSEYISPSDSAITLQRIFLPRNTNVLGTIFGGDILLWMDRVATFCARHFTRNKHMITIAMNQLLFRHPIRTTDLVAIDARVVMVRNFTLEVETVVRLKHINGEEEISHSGHFTILSYDEAGFKRPITTGLKLEDEDQDGLRAYHQARERRRFWMDQTEG